MCLILNYIVREIDKNVSFHILSYSNIPQEVRRVHGLEITPDGRHLLPNIM